MNRGLSLASCGALLLGAFLAASCGTARRGEPVAGPMPLETREASAGRHVFLVHCHQCHPGGEGGLGPALNNKPLPDFLVRLQVRRGLGAMPAFKEEEISDREMEGLLAYLGDLRRHDGGDK